MENQGSSPVADATSPEAHTSAPVSDPPVDPETASPHDSASEVIGASPAVAVPTSLLGRAIAELQEAQRLGHDRLLRMAADFENYKKRSRKEQSEAARRAEEKVVQEFLPVVDNLERALSHSESGAGLLEGVGMVRKQVLAMLERFGIKPFESVGQPFDPERHEAIQQAASEHTAGIVCQEAQRGYLRGDRLVRPALVVVSLGPTPPVEKEPVGSGGDVGTSNSGEP